MVNEFFTHTYTEVAKGTQEVLARCGGRVLLLVYPVRPGGVAWDAEAVRLHAGDVVVHAGELVSDETMPIRPGGVSVTSSAELEALLLGEYDLEARVQLPSWPHYSDVLTVWRRRRRRGRSEAG